MVAWAVLLIGAVKAVGSPESAGVPWVHGGHGQPGPAATGTVPSVDVTPVDVMPVDVAPAAVGAAWLLMVAAMMIPVLVPRVRLVAERSIGRIRNRAIAQTLVGALLVWVAFGIPVVALTLVIPESGAGRSQVIFAGVWLLVVGWQLLPPKMLALRRCHAVVVPGGTADGTRRVVAGAAHAGWCVLSCGPAMVAMAVTGHSMLFMAVLTAGLLAERVVHRPYLAVRGLAAAMAAATLLTVVLGLGL